MSSNPFIKNPQKVELITGIYELRRERGLDSLRLLLDMLIQEIRVDNDIVQPDELKKNQGRIAAYQDLLGYIENGVGIPDERQYGTRIKSMAEFKVPIR